jgi:serine/threonine-protein kinase HipA
LKHWQSVKQLHVQRRLSDGSQVLVGRLAQNTHTVYFQYDADYLANHPSLSPFTLPFASALSPAPFYDVTFSPNPHQEHSTAFMGYGKQPPLKVIQKLATQANFAHWHEAKAVIVQIVEALSQWSTLAKELDISAANRQRVTAQLNVLYQQNKGLLG